MFRGKGWKKKKKKKREEIQFLNPEIRIKKILRGRRIRMKEGRRMRKITAVGRYVISWYLKFIRFWGEMFAGATVYKDRSDCDIRQYICGQQFYLVNPGIKQLFLYFVIRINSMNFSPTFRDRNLFS